MRNKNHGLDGVVAHVTKRKNLLTNLACFPICHACVEVDRRGMGNMSTSQDSGTHVVFAKAEVESGCALARCKKKNTHDKI